MSRRKRKKRPDAGPGEISEGSRFPLRIPSVFAVPLVLAWVVYTGMHFFENGAKFFLSDWVGVAGVLLRLPGILAGGLIVDIALAAAMWFLFRALGAWIMRRLGLAHPSGWESGLAAAGLGAGAASLLLLALGLLGLWRMPIMLLGSLAALAAAAWDAWNRRLSGKAPRPEPAAGGRPGIQGWIALLLMGLAGVMGVVATAAPEIFYDSLVYHLALPKLYLLRGAIVPTPENVYSGLPFGVQALYGWAMALSGENLAALIHASFGMATALGVWAWLGRRYSNACGILGALIYFVCPISMYASWHCGVDLGTSFYVTAALIAMSKSVESEELQESRRWAIAAGALLGAAMGTKYNVIPLSGAFVAVYAYIEWRTRRSWRSAAAMFAAASAVFSPWLMKNILFYGNPVYPFLHQWLGWAAPVSWNEFLAAAGKRDLAGIFSSWSGLVQFLKHPWTNSVGNWPLGDWPGPVFLMLVPWGIFMRWRGPQEPAPRARYAALALAAIGYVVWALASRLVRYALPVIPLIAIAAAVAVERGNWPKQTRVAGWLVAFLASLFSIQAAFRQGWNIQQWQQVGGEIARYDYLTSQRTTYGLPYYWAAKYINENLPQEAKVLFLGESRAFYVERDFIAATVFDENPFWKAAAQAADGEALREAVRRMGITHIFMSARQMHHRAAYPGILPRAAIAGRAFTEFWARYVKLLAQDREDGGNNPRWLSVYEVLPRPRDDGRAELNPARIVVGVLERPRK